MLSQPVNPLSETCPEGCLYAYPDCSHEADSGPPVLDSLAFKRKRAEKERNSSRHSDDTLYRTCIPLFFIAEKCLIHL